MSDLQCAARVFVARHGEALYESDLLSDAGGWLSPRGRQQAKDLAATLAPERISRVWASDMARAVQTAEIVAGALGVDVVVRKGLRESGAEVVQRLATVLDEVAAADRGESVLVVSHGGVMSMALAVLAANLPATHGHERPMPNCGVVALEADADGWACRSWAGVSVG